MGEGKKGSWKMVERLRGDRLRIFRNERFHTVDSPLKIIIVRIFKQIEEAHIRQANARVLLSLYQL